MILPATIGILVIALVFLYFLSSRLTYKILEPMHLAAQKIESILSGEEVSQEVSYEELEPFIRTIKSQKSEIERSIEKLKESERYRREFTANITHELKTPLTSINGYAEMIATGMTKEEDTKNFARIIYKEGSRLLELIESILKLSKIEGEVYARRDLSLDYFDLYELINEIINRFSHVAGDKNININLAGNSIFINGNKRMLEDLVSNLVDNAVKYNRVNGSVNITVLPSDKNIILIVADTGIGIPEEDQQRVFERFYRVDKSRSKKISGSGIGLSIVKHIVEYHKGKLVLNSEVDKGTEVKVILPR
jgi:two-component system phosphate regulon sensor histidine kinase PhoR